jgi:hypothetical protein
MISFAGQPRQYVNGRYATLVSSYTTSAILPGLSARRQRRNWIRRGKFGYNHQHAGTRYLRHRA